MEIGGITLKIGDRVYAHGEWPATVIAIIDEGLFRQDVPAKDWGYLGSGVLLLDDEIGIVHIPDPNTVLSFIDRESDI